MPASASRLSLRLLFAALLILTAACGDKKETTAEYSSRSVARLKMLLPAAPEVRPTPLPASAKSFIVDYENHHVFDGQVEITITRAQYREAVNVSLEGAVQGSLREMKAVPGVKSFQSTVTDAKIAELPARKTNGSYQAEGKDLKFEGLYFAEGQTAWFVLINGPSGKVPGVAKRVLDSVGFSGD